MDPLGARELAFARAVADLSGDRRRLARLVLADPRAAGRTVRWVSALPTRDIALPAGPAADAILAPLRRTSMGLPTGRLARAVLTLPADGGYLRGRNRQALRTNIRHAVSRGVDVCAEQPEAAGSGITHLLANRRIDIGLLASQLDPKLAEATRLFTARAAGQLVAYSVVVVAGRWAWLRQSHAELSDTGSDARWLLHAECVAALIAEGRESLLVESAVGLPEGQRYFQQRTGFEPVNLRIVEPAP